MMNATTIRMTTLALAAILVLGLAGLAQARGHGDWDGGPRYNAPLSQEQEDKAQQIFSSHYEKTEAIRQALITKRAELQAQMVSNSPDKAKIESLSREIGELRGKMLAARTELRTQLDKQGLPMGGYGMGSGYGMGHSGYAMGHGGYGMGHGGYGMGHGGRGHGGGYGGCWR